MCGRGVPLVLISVGTQAALTDVFVFSITCSQSDQVNEWAVTSGSLRSLSNLSSIIAMPLPTERDVSTTFSDLSIRSLI
jgi:hypothetical protein